ncbi:hypothetical protein DL96DRAFT_1681512 [Flagelloscypha sp. PMI_526]|nr:hypothetical protein DL96DRAFT_1681512 [Flagelloscypha sp. PMI_526]
MKSLPVPIEVLPNIIHYLPGQDLKQCCLANSALLALSQPKLFSLIRIPTFRPIDNTCFLMGRGKELAVKHTRGLVVAPHCVPFFTEDDTEDIRQLFLALMKEMGRNLDFLKIRDTREYGDIRWEEINPRLREGLLLHAIPYVRDLSIDSFWNIPLSTIATYAHNVRHLQFQNWSFAEEHMQEHQSVTLPKLQTLTLAFDRTIPGDSHTLPLFTLLKYNKGKIHTLRVSHLHDERGISLWPCLHSSLEKLVYSLSYSELSGQAQLTPKLVNLHTLQYYIDGTIGYHWDGVMRSIKRHIQIQPALRLVEVHFTIVQSSKWLDALQTMVELDVDERIEVNIFIDNFNNNEDCEEIIRRVKKKWAKWIEVGRMEIFMQLNHVKTLLDLGI